MKLSVNSLETESFSLNKIDLFLPLYRVSLESREDHYCKRVSNWWIRKLLPVAATWGRKLK